VPHFRVALAVILCLSACKPHSPPVVDADLDSCIPPGALLIGGIDLRQLRASPLYASLRDKLEPLRDASYAVVASDGSRFLIAARGRLDGATMIGPDLSLTGSPDLVNLAITQHRTGKSGSPDLLSHATTNGPLWIVANGSATLPLFGNAQNLNRLLHFTQYAAVTADASARPTVRVSGQCRNEEDARHLEESIRAIMSLARSPAKVERAGASVVVNLEVEPADLQRLLR
jgi:hypothetical protein